MIKVYNIVIEPVSYRNFWIHRDDAIYNNDGIRFSGTLKEAIDEAVEYYIEQHYANSKETHSAYEVNDFILGVKSETNVI